MKCWGKNHHGQLGDGTTTTRDQPTLVKNLTNAKQISVGLDHTCAVLADKTIKCWGGNQYGQLGDGTTVRKYLPTTTKNLSNAVQVSSGGHFTCAFSDDGTVRCWGTNQGHKLSFPDADFPLQMSTSPVQVKGISNAIQLSLSKEKDSTYKFGHACARLKSGKIICWGGNWYGQTGQGWTGNPKPISDPVKDITNAIQITSGSYHICAIVNDGKVTCWGSNEQGQLGVGTRSSFAQHWKENGISNAKSIASGSDFTCVILKTGEVKCWGALEHPLPGFSKIGFVFSPIAIKHPTDVKQLSLGKKQSCILFKDNTANCWKGNIFRQSLVPQLVHH